MKINTKKVCVVVASRANYGRIKSTLHAIQKHPNLDLQLIVGASALLYRFGQVVDVIKRDGFEPVAKVYSIVEGENLTTMAKSTGLGIIELATLFENLKPDIVLTHSVHDHHQDHVELSKSVFSALRGTDITHIEFSSWNKRIQAPWNFEYILDDDSNKRALLAFFKSQSHRPYVKDIALFERFNIRYTQQCG